MTNNGLSSFYVPLINSLFNVLGGDYRRIKNRETARVMSLNGRWRYKNLRNTEIKASFLPERFFAQSCKISNLSKSVSQREASSLVLKRMFCVYLNGRRWESSRDRESCSSLPNPGGEEGGPCPDSLIRPLRRHASLTSVGFFAELVLCFAVDTTVDSHSFAFVCSRRKWSMRRFLFS